MALSGLAYALAQTGAHDKAAERFGEIVAGREGMLKAEALFQQGWLYAKAGETDKGQKAYEQLLADFPDSAYADQVRDLLGRTEQDG